MGSYLDRVGGLYEEEGRLLSVSVMRGHGEKAAVYKLGRV